jgi:hypothetical protein
VTPLICAFCGQPGPPFHTWPECPAVKARPLRPKLPERLVIGGGTGPAGMKPNKGKVWTRTPYLTPPKRPEGTK